MFIVLIKCYGFGGRGIMKKSLRVLFVLGVLQLVDASAQQAVLSKLFHSTCPLEANTVISNQKNIELGTVTFVFSNVFVINQMSDAKKEEGVSRFFVPGGKIKSSLKVIKDIVCPQRDVYKVTVHEVTSPTNGILFEVKYDPNRVLFSYDIFQRVTREHKLVFYFHDKQLIDKIQAKKEAPMIVQAALNPAVIIDCGHGGHDAGVIGYANIAEKHICLSVGKKIADELKKKGILAILTREQDEYVSLDQRVQYMKKVNPQLLVSIHANASSNKDASGVETYYFDRQQCSLRGDYTIVAPCVDKYKKLLTAKNKQLAQKIQKMVCEDKANKYQIVDRSIKPEPLQVLMTEIPSALIEIGFLTSKQEADLLLQDSYQDYMASGVSRGIISFLAQYSKLSCML